MRAREEKRREENEKLKLNKKELQRNFMHHQNSSIQEIRGQTKQREKKNEKETLIYLYIFTSMCDDCMFDLLPLFYSSLCSSFDSSLHLHMDWIGIKFCLYFHFISFRIQFFVFLHYRFIFIHQTFSIFI